MKLVATFYYHQRSLFLFSMLLEINNAVHMLYSQVVRGLQFSGSCDFLTAVPDRIYVDQCFMQGL
jgi:hypothetical protein